MPIITSRVSVTLLVLPRIPNSVGVADIDNGALEVWLERHVAGFSGPLTINKFDSGQSNPTYRIDTPSGTVVLRRKPFGALLPSAHAIEREYRVMAALQPFSFPVPRVIALCEDAGVIGAPFYLMSMVGGKNFTDGALPGMTKGSRTALYYALVDNLAALHCIDPEAAGLGTFGRPGNFFERQVARWIKQYRASETERMDDMERLIAWLPATLPAQSGISVVHGDYRIDNVIMDPAGGRIAAVLDWELSTLGDPLADFTYFLMNWVTPYDGRSSLQGLDLVALGIPTLGEMTARYCAKAQRAPIDNLDWYFAFNCFRVVGIAQGIKKRVMDGNASNSRATDLASRLPAMAALAWSFAVRTGA